MARILIVEDNVRLASLIADGLRDKGYSCDMAHSLSDADDAMKLARFDALILDLGLPDGDGQQWLRRRKPAGEPPTLILTARNGLEDRVGGLDSGADDYVTKPFAIDELAARLRATLRRPGQRTQTILQVGPVSFDTTTRSARCNALHMDLPRREADLLELLMRRAGQVVRRRDIENALYRFDEAVTPNAVEAVISRLRRKLDEAGAFSLLHTVRGVGYLLREPEE